MWFVHKQVILTKDNLIKRRWVESSRCCFCDHDETIQHLFLECPLPKLLWRTIHIAFNINPPVDIASLSVTWLAGVEQITAARIRIGICALLWAIWNCRNDMIFNRQHINFFAGYLQSYSLDSYMILTHSYGLQGAFGYWVQPMGDGSSGYIQPVRMALA